MEVFLPEGRDSFEVPSFPVKAGVSEKTSLPGPGLSPEPQRGRSLQLVGRGAGAGRFPCLVFLTSRGKKQDSSLVDPISPEQTILRDEAQAIVTGASFNCPTNAPV